jgi:hypothetical protein
VQLVKDVADVLDSVAANQHHTPALYSTFLRALISAKGAPSGMHSAGPHLSEQPDSTDSSNGMNHNGFSGLMPGNPTLAMDEFHFDSEMGPVADMSTFPPTMAAHSSDSMGMLSMDSILSSGFWDNVLVPGEPNGSLGLIRLLIHALSRLLEFAGGPEWRVCLWRWW